eukprot:4320272-Prymnesium_polylepis.1
MESLSAKTDGVPLSMHDIDSECRHAAHAAHPIALASLTAEQVAHARSATRSELREQFDMLPKPIEPQLSPRLLLLENGLIRQMATPPAPWMNHRTEE